jgi:hypothetical protein
VALICSLKIETNAAIGFAFDLEAQTAFGRWPWLNPKATARQNISVSLFNQ